MNPAAILLGQMPLHRIADVCGDAGKIGEPLGVAGNSLAVLDDFQKDVAMRAPAYDGDFVCARVESIFSQLADRLERMRLRAGDNLDGVPLVANAQPAARD